jgi:hypothetical protein
MIYNIEYLYIIIESLVVSVASSYLGGPSFVASSNTFESKSIISGGASVLTGMRAVYGVYYAIGMWYNMFISCISW